MNEPPLAEFTFTPEAFYERFGVGVPEGPIHPVDMAGVLYASIQGLYDVHRAQEKEIRDLRERMTSLQRRGVGRPSSP